MPRFGRKWLFTFLIIIVGMYMYYGNRTIEVTSMDIHSSKIPPSFNGYKIVQLSDVHDSKFGEHHSDVIEKVVNVEPDAIFITGDLIDRNRYDLEQSLDLVNGLKDIAPIYYVTGNHEISTNDQLHIQEELTRLGVHVLSDEFMLIENAYGERMLIGGIEDPLNSVLEDEEATRISLNKTFNDTSDRVFKILLAHRPEQFEVYVDYDIDLIFSGHTHGGQIRLPFIGGVFAPGQGWFPTYLSGHYEKQETQMIVSRGLGNSVIPIRLFNQPEIIVVTLQVNKE